MIKHFVLSRFTPVQKFKINTGCQVNILPKRVFDALKLKDDHNVQIIPSNANLTAYSEQSLTSLGCCILKCTYNEKSMGVKFMLLILVQQLF